MTSLNVLSVLGLLNVLNVPNVLNVLGPCLLRVQNYKQHAALKVAQNSFYTERLAPLTQKNL